ncbi:aminomethyl-transferring glycine dehydrogenase [Blattabacterium cuenoti]|uniref:aminomethyl-transferring glycine dehydrogenase n=1 Tax=Blattabacterium cuenoti TaxID=1653831 RepID=UPI00163BADE7|nr:aminomethyl-transferring glycine dehydrogenase [Blattabacterium cuenoti]
MKEDHNIRRKKFSHRHIGPSYDERSNMLKDLKCSSIKDFIKKIIPKKIRLKKKLNLPSSISEYQYLNHLYKISKKNKIYRSYIGLGYKNTITPSVIQRNILENPNWYTPYTPYQSEISQGRLESLINFQTMISDLTGMKISNASMLDESSAAADAMFMIYQEKIKKKQIDSNYYFFISDEIYPQTIAVLKTRCFGLKIRIIKDSHKNLFTKKYVGIKIFGLIISYPSSLGEIYNYNETIEYAKKNNISVIVSTDILSLSLLKPPGEWGADVVIGSSQSFGIPMGYGGPHAAFFSTHEKYKRFIPGRIIGISVDKENKKVFRMALQTREQHIRREKATSNICTSQVFPAIMASMYALFHGKEGLVEIANRIHEYTKKLEFLLVHNINDVYQMNSFYFDTIRIKNNKTDFIEKLKKVSERKKTNFRFLDKNHLSITLDETTCEKDINHIMSIFQEVENLKEIKKIYYKKKINKEYKCKIPSSLKRTSDFLKNKIFHKFHSENELMRYIKRLERKDLSLNHSMIPLGSCTMKLNASTGLFSLSQYEWRNIHPFVPDKQAMGYRYIINNLKNYFKEITGFCGVSLQPNSGAQGEYAGLMVIKSYYYSRKEFKRNIALIPLSSHGTNPASANMAGMKVVLITTKKNDGSIDIDDLFKKVKEYKDSLSVLMITYPSTHGIYEENIQEIIDIIHENGGQVYMDGANMNAQVGLIKPSDLGVDVCHLNLHKTFSIPHGGGGPGMGPICVASHLKPFLPSHPFLENIKKNEDNQLTISSSPYGSSLILTIPYAYIRLLGPDGLKKCTEISILNANYIKEKLKNYYKILYVGKNNSVAHELIIDCRIFNNSLGIEVIDIAKRMMDYGYHAPTISFPVEGCMMIEPTESESKEELDRFIEMLINIRKEIQEIEHGKFSKKENVLKNAPHSIDLLTNHNWKYPYSREKAAYPLHWVRERKFWPSVNRVDDGYGDRNFICTCT